MLALALPVSAGVRNTIHDFQSNATQGGFGSGTAQRGMCSYCHIHHSSKGDRLWPTPGDSSVRVAGLVGVLCASCHVAVITNIHSPATSHDDVDRTADIYNTSLVNHVLIDDGVYANNTNQNYFGAGVAAQFNQQNVWPYCGTQGTSGSPVQIECSSCHNPHDDSKGQSAETTEANSRLGYGNDFLRAEMYNNGNGVAFCEYCHEEKTRSGAAGNTIGTGTHPVGTTANAGDLAQADIHIESAERATLQAAGNIVSSVFYDMGIGTGNGSALADAGPGTHLTSYDTGGVTCQTCHKVHGAAAGAGDTWDVSGSTGSYLGSADPVYLAASDDGYANILAIENDANGGTVGYTYLTEGRATGDYNDLCIDCHETTPSVGKNWLNMGEAGDKINPDGAGIASSDAVDAHPVNIAPNGVSEVGFALTVKDPGWNTTNSNWTDARWAGNAGTARDFAFVGTPRWYGAGETVGANGARTEIVCLTCHALHDGENGTPMLRANSLTYCNDCHTNSIGLVSHPVGPGSAMADNPDGATWPNGDVLPLANYYQGSGGTTSFNHTPADANLEDMACFTCHAAHDGVDGFMLRVKDDNSRICVGCHTDFVATTGNVSQRENPSNYIAEYAESPTARLGSHYTGTISDSQANSAYGETRWAFSGAWTDTISGPATAQTSHWAGGGSYSRIQCQSCHTPHNAASGLAEANTYDGTTSPVDWDNTVEDGSNGYDMSANYDAADPANTKMCATPTSALLLGNNVDSKICATCHWPSGTHVTTIFTVPANPDPKRVAGSGIRRYRDYCTRTGAFIVSVLNQTSEQAYDVYDLLASDTSQDNAEADSSWFGTGESKATPESPCSFPPFFPGIEPQAGETQAHMVCDSCHSPHAAATGPGAFILESGAGDADGSAANNLKANQRVASRDYAYLCWRCHDK